MVAFRGLTAGLNTIVDNVSTGLNKVNRAVNTARNTVSLAEQLVDPSTYSSALRSANIPSGANPQPTTSPTTSAFNSPTTGDDWRVRIFLPQLQEFAESRFLAPLHNSNSSMVFPTTPQILVQHSANYTPMSPTHSNYAFPVYSNSSVEDITITCEWPVENEADGAYWIASVHFLRSITKMYYGKSQNLGLPPPICKLSGYGSYIFNEMPIVVKMFSMDLASDQDYIKVPLDASTADFQSSGGYTYVPTLGRISVVVGPAYSRNEVLNFSLNEFTRNGQGGFI